MSHQSSQVVQSIRLSVHLCVQHDGHDAVRRVRLFAAAETGCIMQYGMHYEHYSSFFALGTSIFGRPFVKRFALCYRTVVLSVCPVFDVGVLWPNGWTDQDET